MGPDVRRNVQVNQPGIVGNEEYDKCGWPDPLADPSNPLKVVVTSGGNGTQMNKDLTSTSQQDRGAHSLSEGHGAIQTGNMEEQGGHGNKFQTSQQNTDDHSSVESE